MKEKRAKIFKIIGAIASLFIIYFLYDFIMYVSTDNAQVEAHAVMLAAKVGGYVAKVNVNEGQQVKKGDVLVEIDDRDYQNAAKQMVGDLTSIEAKMKDADKNFSRITTLYNGGAVSQQQFDAAATSRSDTKAKFEAISAQVSQAQLNIENTKIKAPSNGFIAKKSVEIGQLASPGVPLLGFVDSEERWVTANFKETEIEAVKIGAKVKIEVDAISGKSFRGTVDSVSSATGAMFSLLPPDNATGNFTKVVQRVPVKIIFNDLSPEDMVILRAGLSALIKVHKH